MSKSGFGAEEDADYRRRVLTPILDQLRRSPKLSAAPAWPQSAALARFCEALFLDPTDVRSSEDWARELGMSSRTLTRRFEAEVGIPLRFWRRRRRLFRTVEFLSSGVSVTGAAMELGYTAASAFIFAFREEMGDSPHAFARLEPSPSGLRTPRP